MVLLAGFFTMTPTIAKKQRWAAEVAHVTREILAGQNISIFEPGHECTGSEENCFRESHRAIEEGRLRLAVLLMASGFGASLENVKQANGYMALPATPAEAIRQF